MPPATNSPSRSFIASGSPKMNISSISSHGAAAAAAWRSPSFQAATIGSIASPWPSQR